MFLCHISQNVPNCEFPRQTVLFDVYIYCEPVKIKVVLFYCKDWLGTLVDSWLQEAWILNQLERWVSRRGRGSQRGFIWQQKWSKDSVMAGNIIHWTFVWSGLFTYHLLQGDPTRLSIVICLWRIEKRPNGMTKFFLNHEFILAGLIIYHSFSLSQKIWSQIKINMFFLEINGKWPFLKSVKKYYCQTTSTFFFLPFWRPQQKNWCHILKSVLKWVI